MLSEILRVLEPFLRLFSTPLLVSVVLQHWGLLNGSMTTGLCSHPLRRTPEEQALSVNIDLHTFTWWPTWIYLTSNLSNLTNLFDLPNLTRCLQLAGNCTALRSSGSAGCWPTHSSNTWALALEDSKCKCKKMQNASKSPLGWRCLAVWTPLPTHDRMKKHGMKHVIRQDRQRSCWTSQAWPRRCPFYRAVVPQLAGGWKFQRGNGTNWWQPDKQTANPFWLGRWLDIWFVGDSVLLPLLLRTNPSVFRCFKWAWERTLANGWEAIYAAPSWPQHSVAVFTQVNLHSGASL